MAGWVDLAASLHTSQRELVGLSQRLAEATGLDSALEQAIETHQAKAFTHLVFARLHAGHALEAGLVARGGHLLPNTDALAALCGRISGDVGSALLVAVRGRKLGWDREPTALLLAELWALREGRPHPEGLLSEARIRARRESSEEGEDALVALHGLLAAPALSLLLGALVSPELEAAAKRLASRLVNAMMGAPLAVFPERPQGQRQTHGPVRRIARVGRNEACPCGSGKKYKQCHEALDQEVLEEGEHSGALEQLETHEQLDALRGHELVRLDPEKIPPPLRAAWLERLGLWGEHAVAALAVARWSETLDPAVCDALTATTAELAGRDGRVDLVEHMVRARGGRTEGLLLETELLLAPEGKRLALLEEMARRELDGRGVETGFALLAVGLPALGIHVARAELALRSSDEETETLQTLLLETRDRLGLPPSDPIEDVLYALDKGVAPAIERELLAARHRVDQGDRALRVSQQALSLLKSELEQREVPALVQEPEPVPVPLVLTDDTAVRELRERVEMLKSELKERHNERNALKRALEEATAEREAPATRDAAPPDPAPPDPGEDAEEAQIASQVRLPRFPEDFDERLREVPDATARATLLRIGELCAGYEAAFREVRPLRALDGVWRAKIGRSYRLLFRLHDGILEVIELLHRQDLEKRLSRLKT